MFLIILSVSFFVINHDEFAEFVKHKLLIFLFKIIACQQNYPEYWHKKKSHVKHKTVACCMA